MKSWDCFSSQTDAVCLCAHFLFLISYCSCGLERKLPVQSGGVGLARRWKAPWRKPPWSECIKSGRRLMCSERDGFQRLIRSVSTPLTCFRPLRRVSAVSPVHVKLHASLRWNEEVSSWVFELIAVLCSAQWQMMNYLYKQRAETCKTTSWC